MQIITFLIEMDQFKRLSNPVPIIYIHRTLGHKGGYIGDEYKKITKVTYLKYETSYHEDVNAFMNFEFGSEIRDTEGNPLPVNKLPYIPLEK